MSMRSPGGSAGSGSQGHVAAQGKRLSTWGRGPHTVPQRSRVGCGAARAQDKALGGARPGSPARKQVHHIMGGEGAGCGSRTCSLAPSTATTCTRQ
jgi:hypothetical protein